MTLTDTSTLFYGVALYQFCIIADEGPRTETFFNLVKLMLCYKLNTLPVQYYHDLF